MNYKGSGEETPCQGKIEATANGLPGGNDTSSRLEHTSPCNYYAHTDGRDCPGPFSSHMQHNFQSLLSPLHADKPERSSTQGDSVLSEDREGFPNTPSVQLSQYDRRKVLQVKLHRLDTQYLVSGEQVMQNGLSGGHQSPRKPLQGQRSHSFLSGSRIKEEKGDLPSEPDTLNLHATQWELDTMTSVKEESHSGNSSATEPELSLAVQGPVRRTSQRQKLAFRKYTSMDESEEEELSRGSVIKKTRRRKSKRTKASNSAKSEKRSDGDIEKKEQSIIVNSDQLRVLRSKIHGKRSRGLVKLRLKIKSCYAKYTHRTCSICQQTFPHADSLTQHMRRHSGKRNSLCMLCDASFKKSSHLKQHMISKHPDSGITTPSETNNRTCPICQKTFSRTDSLTCHMRVHTGDRPFKCKQCDAAYKVSSHLSDHVRAKHTNIGRRLPSKTGNRTCPICQKVFARVDSLTCHMRVHTGDRPFQCKQCDAAYKVSSHLSDHVRSKHTDSRPFECSVCNKTFSYSSAKRRHEQNCGKDFTDRMMFKCANCEKRFMTSDGCKRHEKTCGVDKTDEDTAKAEENEETFRTRTPTGDKEIGDFKCSLCPRHFFRKRCLSLHIMSIHCGMKPYKCNECDLAFASGEKLSRHIRRVHRNEKRFKCMLCGEGFFDSAAWMRHMQRHATQPAKLPKSRRRRELTCTFCNKSFPVISLRNHIKTEHPEVSLSEALARELPQCNICAKTYFSRVGLRHHLKREHPDVVTDEKTNPLPKSPQPDRKPMSCPKCGKQFTNIQCYKVHLKLHWEVKPYICAECGKGYVDIVRLKVHMSKHDGPKPYMCEVCGAGFYYNHLLEQHMERKHTDLQKQQWLCAECGRILARKDHLYKHIKLHAKYPDGKIPTRGRRKGSKNAPKHPKDPAPDELPQEGTQKTIESENDYSERWGRISVPAVSRMGITSQTSSNTVPGPDFIPPQDGFIDLTEAESQSPIGLNLKAKPSLAPVSVTDFSPSEDFMGLAVAKHHTSIESNFKTHFNSLPLTSRPPEKSYMDYTVGPNATPAEAILKTVSGAAPVSTTYFRPEEKDFVNLTVAKNPSSTELFLKTTTNPTAVTLTDFRPADDDFMDLTMVKNQMPMGLNLAKTNTNIAQLTGIKHEQEGFMNPSVSESRANFGMFGMHNFQHQLNTYTSYIHDSILGLDRRNVEAGNRGIKN